MPPKKPQKAPEEPIPPQQRVEVLSMEVVAQVVIRGPDGLAITAPTPVKVTVPQSQFSVTLERVAASIIEQAKQTLARG
jgi:hypothetical protein